MEATTSKFDKAIAKIDQANAQDPNQEIYQGQKIAKELAYSMRMTNWLLKLKPDASESLQLAARAQHIQRWTIPRDSYPMDRKGYLKWRTMLKLFHAEKAGEIMIEFGYDDQMVARVQSLIKKEKLKKDPETQLLEDVICLVFLESYFADFSTEHDHDKVISIIQKTWGKMSEQGHQAALKLNLNEQASKLVQEALA